MGKTEGKLGLLLMGGAMLSKSLIQYSVDGWSCVPSLLFRVSKATHSSTLAWKIPWTEEPGGLQSMGSQRVGHDSIHAQASIFLSFKWECEHVPCRVMLEN